MKPIAEKKSATSRVANSKKTVSAQQRKLKNKKALSSTKNKSNGAETALYENHPLASVFGAFNDDPLWEEIMENVRKNREDDIKNFRE